MIAIMSDWHIIFDGTPRRDLPDGEPLFLRQEPVRSMFLVTSGTITLERSLPDGTGLTVHTAGAGRLLAEASLFAETYHCDGIARGGARIAVMPRLRFLETLDAHPELARGLLADTAQEVQSLRTRVEILRLRRLGDRLDAWLELYGKPGLGGWVRVADAIGVTPAALYRELSRRRRP